MIFFGDPQKSMLDDEQSAPDELEAGEIEEADEPESEMPENSIYEGYTDEELLVHIRTHEGNEALD
ncbi:MAG: hypothetical protein ACFNLJ_05290 [Selenomonas artemidis]